MTDLGKRMMKIFLDRICFSILGHSVSTLNSGQLSNVTFNLSFVSVCLSLFVRLGREYSRLPFEASETISNNFASKRLFA